ncbi:CE1759 family FMN reductase [Rarobacter incanus]|uniref:FMN reductase n=1 Tax=Rarobacter incanus TaxID=153494 RepID=A0A542SMW2_9MICO|nr:CE1759 family FMN reductase [Rarobacter incanus]TQK75971.1 FMN reductase [Rarobacter incanus]
MDPKTLSLVAVSAGVSDPSTTRMLAERIGLAARDHIVSRDADARVDFRVIDLRPLAADIAAAAAGGITSQALRDAMDAVRGADGLIAVSPVFKAGMTGLFKSFFDIADDDSLIAMPVLLAATAGTPRHALVIESAMRPLFSYLRAFTVPTGVFAATEDWARPSALTERIKRAAGEFAVLVGAGVRARVLDVNRTAYGRSFESVAAERGEVDAIDFDTDLMRLATGGSAN